MLLLLFVPQSAPSKVARQLKHAVRQTQHRGNISQICLVWGGGSFGPTSRGYDSAPNKSLRRGLIPFFPIVIVSERYTSQRCARGCTKKKVPHAYGPTSKQQRERYRARAARKKAKEEEVTAPATATEEEEASPPADYSDLKSNQLKKKLRGLFHCIVCRTTWNRDTCAAINILRIFEHQRSIPHGELLTRPWDLNAGPDNRPSTSPAETTDAST